MAAGASSAGAPVVAYLRVSTDQQDAENQRLALQQMARGRGWTVVRWYVDDAVSGRSQVRPAFDQMMADAKRGRFRLLLAWSIDRLGRNMHRTIGDVLELDRLGVGVVSLREPWLDQQGPARSLLLAVLAWVAEQEHARLLERLHAARIRLEARGGSWGRPRRMTDAQVERARELREQGKSYRQMAIALKVPRATIRRALARA